MSEISALSPRQVWEVFDLICSIPHPSGHESQLAAVLKDYAAARNLQCRMDAAGNLRVDRPASPGFENAPHVILQAHLDMVPLAEDPDFDFVTTPVTPYIDGDRVRAKGTTLGADDGIGVALAMAALCDPEFKCGRLSALFTVDEEVGLKGANQLDTSMLAGDMLINLDSGPENTACIGCAGGARQEFTLPVGYETAPAGLGCRIAVSGMKGGHSGICIHLPRGNALKLLASFLLEQPGLHLSSFSGGSADNAIPDSASAEVVFTGGGLETLQGAANIFTALLKKELDTGNEFAITVVPVPAAGKVLDGDSQQRLLSALNLVPNGALEMDEELKIVRTSSNLAAVVPGDEYYRIRTSQRSLDDAAREQSSEMVALHFANFGGSGRLENVYPGWLPRPDCRLVKKAVAVWEKSNGSPMSIYAIHAGLEAGLFGKRNPELELISLGADYRNCHTPEEYVSISSVSKFYPYLKELLASL